MKHAFLTRRNVHENQGLSRRAALYLTHLRGLSVFGDVLWLFYAKSRVFLCLSPVYEPVHFCRVHGVRHSQSAAPADLSACPRLSADHHGQRPTSVLWAVAAGQIQKPGLEKALPHLRPVRRDVFHPLHGGYTGGGGPRLVHVLRDRSQPGLLGGRRHGGGLAGLHHPLQHQGQ